MRYLARTTAMRFLPPRPNADGETLAYFFRPTEEICRDRDLALVAKKNRNLGARPSGTHSLP